MSILMIEYLLHLIKRKYQHVFYQLFTAKHMSQGHHFGWQVMGLTAQGIYVQHLLISDFVLHNYN